MVKKFLMASLLLVCAVLCVLAVACGTDKPDDGTGDNTNGGQNPPAGHTHEYGDWVSKGETMHGRFCSCGFEQTEYHNWSQGIITKIPTCKEKGEMTFICVFCEETRITEIKEFAEHIWGYVEVTKEPTCKENGIKTYTCVTCNDTKTEIIDKLTAHRWDDGEITKEPTCKENGIKTYTCATCKDTKTEIIDKLTTHNFKDEWTVTDSVHCHECVLCQERKDIAAHNFYGNECSVCRFVKGSQGIIYVLNDDGKSYFVHSLGTTTQKSIVIASVYNELPVTRIKDNAFNGSDITAVFIPDSVTEIGRYAFAGCENLVTANIPAGVTELSSGVFSNCRSLTNITLPDGVRVIGESAFEYCGFTEINFLNKVNDIGERAFAGCEKLVTVNIPDSVTEIGRYAFAGCENLVTANIPAGVTGLSSGVFSNCRSLTDINLPDGLESIGESAFASCEYLLSLTIPKTVTFVGREAFSDCKRITVYCEAASKPSGWDENWNCLEQVDFTVPVVWDCVNNDADENGYFYGVIGNFKYGFKDGTAKVVKYISNGDGGVVIPRTLTFKGENYTVTEIGRTAFIRGNFASIVLPDTVTVIGDYAFLSCKKITELNLPDGVTHMGEGALGDCVKLTTITVPDGVTEISDGLFEGCSELRTVILPDEIVSVGKDAFAYCYAITEITFGDGLQSIGEGAFGECTRLARITLPSSLKTIGRFAFTRANKLTEIIFLGTVGQWNEIVTEENWNYESGNYTVKCMDGTVGKA